MKYKFKSREQLIEIYNSIKTPHSHGIVLDGNSINVKYELFLR